MTTMPKYNNCYIDGLCRTTVVIFMKFSNRRIKAVLHHTLTPQRVVSSQVKESCFALVTPTPVAVVLADTVSRGLFI